MNSCATITAMPTSCSPAGRVRPLLPASKIWASSSRFLLQASTRRCWSASGLRVKPAARYYGSMTTEERIERVERKIQVLATVQDQMMDLLGMTVEGERRLATRMEEVEELRRETDRTIAKIVSMHAETDEKLNALIGIVDGFIRGKG